MTDLDEKDLLARELHERAGDVSGQPVSFQAVRAGAKHMQLRRNVVTGAVTAAVAGIALPTGIGVTAALNDSGDRVDQPEIADTPSVTAGPSRASRPDGAVPLTLDGLQRGADPGIDHLDGSRLVLADGRVVQLGKEYQEITPLQDGWLAIANDQGELTRDLLDSEGRVTNSLLAGAGIATNLDGTRVAFVQIENGRWNLLDVIVDAMDPRSPSNVDNRPIAPVGYAGDGVLVYNLGDGEDVEVRVFEPSAEDYELPAAPQLLTASAASEAEGLVAGMTETYIDGSCWAVVRYDSGDANFETCDHALGPFSPDGAHVIGTDAYGDGLGPRSMAVLDTATGELVVSFEQTRDAQLVLGDMAWEDDEHVLTTVTDGLVSHTVRFGLDGTVELASERYVARDYDTLSPVRFGARP